MTDLRTATQPVDSAPALRRLPIPVVEPLAAHRNASWRRERGPHGDNRHTVAPTQGALALAFVASTPEYTRDYVETYFGPQPTSTASLPDVQQTCTQLVQAVVEVLSGVRPVSQLIRWMTPEVYNSLARRAALSARLGHHPAGAGRRAVVRRVHICAPADGVAEASAVVVDRGRVRAVAVRLEGLDGRWRATALEVG